MADAPGFQLLAGLNSSLFNLSNDGSETSSHGSDIPAKLPPTPKRKRREAEMLRQPTRLNGGVAENLNEGRQLRRPRTRRGGAAQWATSRRGEHIYDLPSSPEANRLRRSTRMVTQRPKQSPPPAEMWSDEKSESGRDGEDGGGVNVNGEDEDIHVGGEQEGNRDARKEDKKEKDSDADYEEEKEGENDKDDDDYDEEEGVEKTANEHKRTLRENRRKPQQEEVEIVPSSAGSASDDEIVEPEADEPLNESRDKHEDENMDGEDRDGITEEAREEADDSEKESEYSTRPDVWDDSEKELEDMGEDVFKAAATLYGQEDRWAALLSVTKAKHNQPKNALVCHLLRKITRAKQLYDRTREIRHSGESVASHLEDEEEANKSGIIRTVSNVLSETKIQLTRDGRVTSSRELTEKREVVNDIIDHLIPQMVELLKFCITAHCVNGGYTIEGMRQVVPLLKTLDEIFDNVRPTSFKPHIYLDDRFRSERPAARELTKTYKYELEMWEGRIWRKNYNRSIEMGRESWLQGKDDIPSDQPETVIPTTEGGWDDKHHPVISRDRTPESFANHSPSPEPHVWTDEQSKALIAGLKKHQGPDRYPLILKEYDSLLHGRTSTDLEIEARRIRDAYVAAMAEQNRRLDPQRLRYLLEV
ncbi:hypothetical protein FQN52_009110 [Onygenales sp. PD_12]|nr:hypothetical protein FQN53_008494 [Emmonsiellopsis sp. PD_33]KAK2784305.1 hypothetical protein FQN52_009110 [Onygenales sp. PD_12]KAK2805646.1 hypothetical protein FQN51_009149 [Onygenales sp. PD_10]